MGSRTVGENASMKGLIASILTTTFTLGLGAGVAQAQKWTGSVPLGDVARQLKAQRAKSAKKPRVFTNDDLAALRSSGDQSPPLTGTSSSTSSKPAKHPAPSREHAPQGQVTQGAASAPTGEWAKAKFRAAPGVV